MPIGGLLAEIKGEPPKTPPAPQPKLSSTAENKRKAENGLIGHTAKTARTSEVAQRTSRPPTEARSDDRTKTPAAGQGSKLAGPSGSSSLARKQPGSAARPFDQASSSTTQNEPGRLKEEAGKNANTTNVSTTANKVPKKGSYAEIIQRAQIGQERVGPIGRIQHKPLSQTTSSGSGRTAPSMARRPGGRKVWRSEKLAGNGLVQSQAHRGVAQDRSSRETSSDRATQPAKSAAGQKIQVFNRIGGKIQPAEPEKKVKKAALATTGYKGTARPVVNSKVTAQARNEAGGAPYRAGGNVKGAARYAGLLGSRRSRREEEDDEEMDDFIEYDDDEDAQPDYLRARGRYDESEEDESDMEAGFTDMEFEDQRASAIAQREDQEQEALERKLKREKEERKKKLLQGRR
jgi:protein SPT2